MADIRINSLPTTASASSSDDFLALDGATNGTRKLNAYSPTFGGNLTVSGTATIGSSADVKLARGPSGSGNLAVTAATDGYCEITARGAAGNLRIFSAYTGGNFNWYWGADASAQTGSNAGSNFVLVAGSDTGSSLGSYLTVNRATAATTLTGNLTVSGTGTHSFNGPVSITGTTASNILRLTKSGAGSKTFGIDNALDFRIYADNGSTQLFKLTDSGDTTLTGNLTVSGTGTSSVAGTLNVSGGFILNRINAKGIYTGTSDNCGFTWTGTNGEFSTASGSLILKSAGTTALTLDSSQNATFAGNVTLSKSASGAEGPLIFITNSAAAAIQNRSSLRFGTSSSFNTSTSAAKITCEMTNASNQASSLYFDTYNGANVLTALTLDSSQNATFAGTTVKISNAASPQLNFNNVGVRDWYAGVQTANDRLVFGTSVSSSGGHAIRIDSSLNVYVPNGELVLTNALKLGNAYTAGAPTATGYVTIKDSAGNTYKVLVGT